MILFLPFLTGCYGLSIRSIIIKNIKSTPKPPPHDQPAKLARYVMHYSDWGSIATISCRDPIKGLPFSNVISLSDGTNPKTATGIPYMYFADMEMPVEDINCKNEMSLSMTLAQGEYCKQKGLDPQDPPCPRLILTGSTEKIPKNTTEYFFAKKALFTRHPNMINYPDDHKFYFTKMNVKHIILLAAFGGPTHIDVNNYFNAT